MGKFPIVIWNDLVIDLWPSLRTALLNFNRLTYLLKYWQKFLIPHICALWQVLIPWCHILTFILKEGQGQILKTCTFTFLLGHRSQRFQWPIVITRCPSSVCCPLDNLHFRLLFQNCLIDFDETWYGGSTQGPLQVLLFFGQIRPGADPGQGQNRSHGVPFLKNLLLQTRRL